MLAGIVLLMIGLPLAFVGMHYGLGGWYGVLVRGVFGLGLVALGVGVLGFIFGGRHKPGQARRSSAWTGGAR